MANSNWNLDLDDDDDEGKPNQQNMPKGLRQHLKKLEDDNKAMLDELGKYRSAARRGTIEEILAEKKMNPKIARLVPADLEATKDNVEKWLTDNADVFTPQTPPPDDGEGDGDVVDEDPYVLEREQYSRRNRVESAGTAKVDRNTDSLSRIQSFKTRDELDAYITSKGGGYGRG